MAERIQRRRTKGWRMPEGAVYVGRPTRWGNPFKAGDEVWSGIELVDKAHAAEHYRIEFEAFVALNPEGAERVKETIRAELRGKNLACWCPLDQPCHADVLLEIANG